MTQPIFVVDMPLLLKAQREFGVKVTQWQLRRTPERGRYLVLVGKDKENIERHLLVKEDRSLCPLKY